MKKEDIYEFVKKPGMIPGIYNYCDYWCERCAFTIKCSNFAIGELQKSEREKKDCENFEFWNALSEVFGLTFELIQDMVEEHGLDFDEFYEEAMKEDIHKNDTKILAMENESARLSLHYSDKARNWLKQSEKILLQKERELNRQLHLDIPGTNPHLASICIEDALDVIKWYVFQIHVKIMRGLNGKLQGTEELEILKDSPKDSDGSAKVALIGIDRSISAWVVLLKNCPSAEDTILEHLVILEKLRKLVEKEFPDARNFIRPGFDEKF